MVRGSFHLWLLVPSPPLWGGAFQIPPGPHCMQSAGGLLKPWAVYHASLVHCVPSGGNLASSFLKLMILFFPGVTWSLRVQRLTWLELPGVFSPTCPGDPWLLLLFGYLPSACLDPPGPPLLSALCIGPFKKGQLLSPVIPPQSITHNLVLIIVLRLLIDPPRFPRPRCSPLVVPHTCRQLVPQHPSQTFPSFVASLVK